MTTPTATPGDRDRYVRHLTPDDSTLVLVDHVTGFLPGLRSVQPADYQAAVRATARLARIFSLPCILLGDPGGWQGQFMPVIRDEVPDAQHVTRHTPSAWREPAFRDAVRATGRNRLILAGISLDNCLTLTATDLLAAGYDVHIVVDASGTSTTQIEHAAMLRLALGGAVLHSWVGLASELLADWNNAAGAQVGELFQQLSPWGAYGALAT